MALEHDANFMLTRWRREVRACLEELSVAKNAHALQQCCPAFHSHVLRVDQFQVISTPSHQRSICSALHNPTTINNNRRKPKSYSNRSTTSRRTIQGRLHNTLRPTIQRRSRFIQPQNLRISQQGPHNSDPQLLAFTKHCNFSTHHGLQACRKRSSKIVNTGFLAHFG